MDEGFSNIGVTLFAAGVLFVALRYFTSQAASAGATTASDGRGGRRRQVRQSEIEQVQAMFPQVSLAAIKYDLERQGGSVESTCERILREGRLPEPPASFFADGPPRPTPILGTTAQAAATAARNRPASTASSSPSGAQANLLRKYGLEAKAKAEEDAWRSGQSIATAATAGKDLSREDIVRDRKTRMILDARLKLLKSDATAASSAVPAAERQEAQSAT
ncbi:uncharacterized protein L969DRAFT_96044 [Mixia osmundae IAM 14324]|uniref:Coupling of ubiquitin conjugation to ER degradation protein 1 n=1 Tax=Mixia osmundae (strain CBS 9802 / IAM 14324 / JCM 22182 / KY 12970) TaxID=764103 RepID=G7DS72_MIXOS|nr:uncharacterized protein L969DRAFT_96044 [Mixia osmundae IAM 14324]KEI37515.1 hypothetical protein L969DRAFT_96044 [Mixia osmundae IAM 14324]GAA93432.1 hypothetical protein E5Q_00073 [Mixia osmundae IAM 14324]